MSGFVALVPAVLFAGDTLHGPSEIQAAFKWMRNGNRRMRENKPKATKSFLSLTLFSVGERQPVQVSSEMLQAPSTHSCHVFGK